MARPIIAGIIGEVLVACSVGRIVNETVDLARRIKDKDPALDGQRICAMFNVADFQATPKFWESQVMMCNLTASVIEKITMEVANPLLEVLTGTTPSDISDICRCTDAIQVEAMPIIIDCCKQYWSPLVIRRQADIAAEREAEDAARMHEADGIDDLLMFAFGGLMAGMLDATANNED